MYVLRNRRAIIWNPGRYGAVTSCAFAGENRKCLDDLFDGLKQARPEQAQVRLRRNAVSPYWLALSRLFVAEDLRLAARFGMSDKNGARELGEQSIAPVGQEGRGPVVRGSERRKHEKSALVDRPPPRNGKAQACNAACRVGCLSTKAVAIPLLARAVRSRMAIHYRPCPRQSAHSARSQPCSDSRRNSLFFVPRTRYIQQYLISSDTRLP